MNTSTPTAGSSSNGDDGGDTTMDGNNNQISQDLPFLVTHWLANYNKNNNGNGNNNGNNNEETTMTMTASTTTTTTTNTTAVDDDLQTMQRRAEAMAKIRTATADIASAFASLGAFGTTTRVRQLNKQTFHHRESFFSFFRSFPFFIYIYRLDSHLYTCHFPRLVLLLSLSINQSINQLCTI
jgi:hypothetical protein